MSVIIDEEHQKAPLTASADQIRKMYACIENEVLPKTTASVKLEGNKVFGAAILDSELKSTCIETNSETKCPIFHGEVHCIFAWSQQTPPEERGPLAQKSIFLSTHEPCCMCISSILCAGCQTLYYFFPYSISSAQGVPHDIQTMHELWGVTTYRKQNKYLSSACLMDLVEALPAGEDKKELLATQQRLLDAYAELSNQYHSEKANNPKNSLVLG